MAAVLGLRAFEYSLAPQQEDGSDPFSPGNEEGGGRPSWGLSVKHGQTGGLSQEDILTPSVCDKARGRLWECQPCLYLAPGTTVRLSSVRSGQAQLWLKVGVFGLQDSGALHSEIGLFLHSSVHISTFLQLFLTLHLLIAHFKKDLSYFVILVIIRKIS